ncbi:MAG: type II secretion system protein [bacterium]|nr:type II secretion system GspH family protein [bacterium]MBU1917182.1 type II secretion system GspH family protein [bacterium]
MNPFKSHKGFTLLELILTISLMGILGVSVIPLITSTQAFGLDNATRKLESDIRFAQSMAMTKGEAYGFRNISDGKNTTFEVYIVATGLPEKSPYSREPLQEDISDKFKGIFFKDNNHHITFDAQGNPTFITGGQYITLKNQDAEVKAIFINNVGLITIP